MLWQVADKNIVLKKPYLIHAFLLRIQPNLVMFPKSSQAMLYTVSIVLKVNLDARQTCHSLYNASYVAVWSKKIVSCCKLKVLSRYTVSSIFLSNKTCLRFGNCIWHVWRHNSVCKKIAEIIYDLGKLFMHRVNITKVQKTCAFSSLPAFWRYGWNTARCCPADSRASAQTASASGLPPTPETFASGLLLI